MQGRSEEDTPKATKLWVDLFCEKTSPPAIEDMKVDNFPPILMDFYIEVKKKEKPKKVKEKLGN